MSKYFEQGFAQAQRSSDDCGLKNEFWILVSKAEVMQGLGKCSCRGHGVMWFIEALVSKLTSKTPDRIASLRKDAVRT